MSNPGGKYLNEHNIDGGSWVNGANQNWDEDAANDVATLVDSKIESDGTVAFSADQSLGGNDLTSVGDVGCATVTATGALSGDSAAITNDCAADTVTTASVVDPAAAGVNVDGVTCKDGTIAVSTPYGFHAYNNADQSVVVGDNYLDFNTEIYDPASMIGTAGGITTMSIPVDGLYQVNLALIVTNGGGVDGTFSIRNIRVAGSGTDCQGIYSYNYTVAPGEYVPVNLSWAMFCSAGDQFNVNIFVSTIDLTVKYYTAGGYFVPHISAYRVA